jgi:hypothetical protein
MACPVDVDFLLEAIANKLKIESQEQPGVERDDFQDIIDGLNQMGLNCADQIQDIVMKAIVKKKTEIEKLAITDPKIQQLVQTEGRVTRSRAKQILMEIGQGGGARRKTSKKTTKKTTKRGGAGAPLKAPQSAGNAPYPGADKPRAQSAGASKLPTGTQSAGAGCGATRPQSAGAGSKLTQSQKAGNLANSAGDYASDLAKKLQSLIKGGRTCNKSSCEEQEGGKKKRATKAKKATKKH